MAKFIMKHIDNRKPQLTKTYCEDISRVKNKKENSKVMTTSEKIEMAKGVLNGTDQTQRVKKVKRDKGLIERTESSKIVLTEDNKELLID